MPTSRRCCEGTAALREDAASLTSFDTLYDRNSESVRYRLPLTSTIGEFSHHVFFFPSKLSFGMASIFVIFVYNMWSEYHSSRAAEGPHLAA